MYKKILILANIYLSYFNLFDNFVGVRGVLNHSVEMRPTENFCKPETDDVDAFQSRTATERASYLYNTQCIG